MPLVTHFEAEVKSEEVPMYFEDVSMEVDDAAVEAATVGVVAEGLGVDTMVVESPAEATYCGRDEEGGTTRPSTPSSQDDGRSVRLDAVGDDSVKAVEQSLDAEVSNPKAALQVAISGEMMDDSLTCFLGIVPI
jgi:hypothetical protein